MIEKPLYESVIVCTHLYRVGHKEGSQKYRVSKQVFDSSQKNVKIAVENSFQFDELFHKKFKILI